MAKNFAKSTGNKQVNFTKASERLRKRIVKALGQISDTHASLRTSIMEAGQALTQLQAMAKNHHVAFAGIVEGPPYFLPVTTAYHYMRCYKQAGALKHRVYVLALDAGFDPAQPRVLKYLKTHQDAVAKLTPYELGQKLERTRGGGKTGRAFFQEALIKFAKFQYRKGWTISDIKSEITSMLRRAETKIRKASGNKGLSVVKAA
jgi:hypothetical protein